MVAADTRQRGGLPCAAPMNVTREKLYEEVWAEPMTTVAKRYDVASGYLARVCEQLNIPRPARGYWQQLKVGRPPKKPKLPEPRPGDDLDAFVASVEPFARKLLDVQRQARALGIFVDDRELLTCPKCGLTEDVLSDGRLITFSGSRGPDSGLRFIEPTSADGRYTCPRCGGKARSG